MATAPVLAARRKLKSRCKAAIKCVHEWGLRIPLFHVASMARSGETLLLHLLNGHPDVRVSHNLWATDSPEEQKLMGVLASYKETTIPLRHPLLRTYGADSTSVIVVKQGVWEHKWPFRGIILARNPLAVYASLRTYDIKEHGDDADKNWKDFCVPRFLRWLQDIDASLVEQFISLCPLEQFCLFYNRRMGGLLANTDNKILLYESLVRTPMSTLENVCALFGKTYEESMMRGTQHSSNCIGHGNFSPNRPVTGESLGKYMSVLNNSEIKHIIEHTDEVASGYGYCLRNDGVDIVPMERAL